MSFLVNKFGVEAQAGGVGTELNVRKIPQASAFHSNSCTKIGVAHQVRTIKNCVIRVISDNL